MLTSWIVASYETLVELALWAFLIVGGIIGASFGSILGHGFFGFVIGSVTAFFGMSVFLGAAMLLGEILKTVKLIESKLSIAPNQATPAE